MPNESTGQTLKRLRAQRQNAISAGMRKHWEKRHVELNARRAAKMAVPLDPIIHPQDAGMRVFVPTDVLADRDRREQLAPQSLTAALMGDPPPGRSALDMRKPRIVVRNE